MKPDDEQMADRSDGSRPQELLGDELLSAYVDGELVGTELARVESRLQEDAQARRWVDDLRTLSGLMQSLPRGRLAPDLRDQVLRRVKQERLSRDGKQSASLTSTLADASQGALRRWLWSGLAVAAVLLLMLWQPGQPEAERRVADVQPGPVRSGQVKEKRVLRSEDRRTRIEERGMRSEERGARGAEKLAAKSVPSVASLELTEELLAADAGESRAMAPMSHGLGGGIGGRSPARTGVHKLHSSTQPDLPALNKRTTPRQTKPDLVVPMILHDPRRDRPWFRQLLTKHGMEPMEASTSSQKTDALSTGTLEEGFGQQTTRSGQQAVIPGELVDMVVVETLPERLGGLLQACRTDPELHVTVGQIFPEGVSLSGSLDMDAYGTAEVYSKNRKDKKQTDLQQQLQIPGDATGTVQMPVRVRFELRTMGAR
jgi:hypothetical protein